MMKHNYTKYYLIILMITSLVSCSQHQLRNKTTDETVQSKYAFVFDSVSRLGLESVSLYGHYPLKQKVYLLGKDQSEICEAITAEHGTYHDEVKYFPYTTLKAVHSCQRVGYAVAVFDPILSYKTVNLLPIYDPSIISRLEMLVRNSSVPQKLSNKAQGLVPGEKDYPIQDLIPKVYRFEAANAQGYIVSYDAGEKYPSGPRFIVFGDSVYAFTGWCSCPYVNAFMLNNNLYFESGSGCCSCGISLKELYKIEKNKVEIVLSDASESD
jgi:hypothetical protein